MATKKYQGKAKVLSIIGGKGGSYKTTTAFELAVAWGQLGRKVLCLDYDIQGNLTSKFMGPEFITKNAPYAGSFSALIRGDIRLMDIKVETRFNNVDLVPMDKFDSRGNRYEPDTVLSSADDSSTWTRELLLDEELIDYYDYVIIDNAPEVKKVQANSLLASDWVFLPIVANDLAIGSLEELVSLIRKISAENKGLQIIGAANVAANKSSRRVYNTLKERLESHCKAVDIDCLRSSGRYLAEMAIIGNRSVFELTEGNGPKLGEEWRDLSREILGMMENATKVRLTEARV